MGAEFWWFYDVIVLAIVLVSAFFAGRKGFARSLITLVGYAISAVIAFSVSAGISGSIYDGTIKDSNANKLEKSISKQDFISKTEDYLENLEYNINVNPENLEKIFTEGGDISDEIYRYVNNINGKKVAEEGKFGIEVQECYGSVFKDMISKQLSKFSAESVSEKFKEGQLSIDEVAPLLMQENPKEAAKYIAEEFVSGAYMSMIRLIAFVVLFVLIAGLFTAFVNAFMGKSDVYGIATRIGGVAVGVINGAILVFVVAAAVRLSAIMGSNEMLFFNNEAVDKTFVFRYFYDFTAKM